MLTVAWAGTICSDPAMVSISVRPGRYSYDLIKETGDFVINLTTEELLRATDYCGVVSGRNIDKFKEMNLTPSPSLKVKAPGILESPVNIECRVVEIKPLGTHDMFIADIVGVNVDESLLDEKGKLHLSKAGLCAYAHGEYYALGEKVGKAFSDGKRLA